jgi:hypothetical protein
VIIQVITLSWSKVVRGAPFSTLRNRYNYSFPLLDLMLTKDSRIPIQEINLTQNTNGIEVKSNRVNYIDSDQIIWMIGCIEIEKIDDTLIVQFKYSDICGKPKRFDSRYNYMTEKAFELQRNEYGRISYNGRHVRSTGEWIYQNQTINIYNTLAKDKGIFTKVKPMKEYKQMAVLF